MQTETQRTRKDDSDTTTTPRREGRPARASPNLRLQGEGEAFGAQAWSTPAFGAWQGYSPGQSQPIQGFSQQGFGQGYAQQGYAQQGVPQGFSQANGHAQPGVQGFQSSMGYGMGFPNPIAAIAPTLQYGLAGLADLVYRGVSLATTQGQAILGALQRPMVPTQGFANAGPQPVAWPNARLPAVDIVDEGSELVCQVELPGVKPENVDVACHGRGILVTAQAEPDIDLGALVQAERGLQVTYRRAIPLPAPVNPSGAKARLRDGVLTINAPKTDPTEGPRRVPVE